MVNNVKETRKFLCICIGEGICDRVGETKLFKKLYQMVIEYMNGYNQNDEIYDYIIECISSSKTADLIRSQIK